MIRFSQLEGIIRGSVLSSSIDTDIQSVCIDSRKAGIPQKSIFFAIRGERHDGHDYLQALYKAGFRQFVVETTALDLRTMNGCNIIQVASSVIALQQLAAFHRKNFSIPVLGITGSNGKTIIKEWLSQLLSGDKVVVRNPGSYNSQVGVPLSVLQIQSHHQIAIFEAGISKPGEMKKLEQVIRPTIGIFTNIGTAHDEGFKDRNEKINEKLKLFSHSDIVIYCKDHKALHNLISNSNLKTITWGTEDSDIKISHHQEHLTIAYHNSNTYLSIPFSDAASIENLSHCISAMIVMGYAPSGLQKLIAGLRPVKMRMQLKDGVNRCQVIDDTYNNDLGGLQIALQFLSNQNQKKKKRVILSDIFESGLSGDALVASMLKILDNNDSPTVVAIGPVLSSFRSSFPPSAVFYLSTQEFLDRFDFSTLHDEVILVKGARNFRFEKIISRLQRKVHGTVMEIDLDALVHNFNYFKSRIRPTTKVMVMVKAFAYGSGSTEIANLLQYHQADYLGVAYADEGIELRRNNIGLPIMVMNPTEESFESLFAYNLEPEIYSIKILRSILIYLQNRPCTIHLKLDTGMRRLGFDSDTLEELKTILISNSNLRIASVFSHLAGADEGGHDYFSRQQFDTFLSAANSISEAVGYKPLYHILNTPGILRLPEYQLDMVRLGIGMYGIDPTGNGSYPLQPVATLKTIISQLKAVRKGESIGYGRRGVAAKDLKIATIAIGYADGFSRAFSGGVGEVLVNGMTAKVIGNVCMDMTMIDVTGITTEEGDEVILFGKDLPIQRVAAKINTIAYEILTNTNERVKRVFLATDI
ncbi:MAG: bifunctional UDP-N-acetylmuramoyl-tripeptide:D-alanyl-D-alanine ligase/alanine racemase [Chryseolinea sp.]